MTSRPPTSVLLLEGPLSPLYRLIARRLEEAGVSTRRINLCAGDRAAWGMSPAIDFRGRKADWPAFVAGVMERHAIDAVLMHSERRPYHLEAAAEARCRGIDVLVTELGYLRPDFMTIERNGNSVDSLFPTDPVAIAAIAARVPEVDRTLRYPREAGLETFDDLRNSLPNVLFWFLYPHYRAHGLYHPFVAYARFLRREAQAGARTAAARLVRERLRPPYYLFAMQTDTDFQIRANSQFSDMAEALGLTFRSFAAHAPSGARLVVKKHPGDLGPVDWAARVPELAAAAGLAERVDFVDGLPMPAWLDGCAGLVTVNSSVGIDALAAGRPTVCLSPAIYDVPGLTFAGPLDHFWTGAVPPDPALFAAFERALAASVQVRGTIYSRAGTRAATEAIAARIVAGKVGSPGAEGEAFWAKGGAPWAESEAPWAESEAPWAESGAPPRHRRAAALGIR